MKFKPLLLCAALAALNAGAEEHARTELSVAVDAWPPFRMLGEHTHAGIDISLWQRLAAELQVELRFVQCPWVRCLKLMEEGLVDAMGGLAYRDERALYMDYVQRPYYRCSTVFYLQRGQGERVKVYDDLYALHIGVVPGSAYFTPFDTDPDLHKIGVSNESQLIEMLGRKRLDAIVGTDCQADYQIAQSPYRGQFEKGQYQPGNQVDLYLAVSKRSPYAQRLDELAGQLDRILDSGGVDAIAQRYFH